MLLKNLNQTDKFKIEEMAVMRLLIDYQFVFTRKFILTMLAIFIFLFAYPLTSWQFEDKETRGAIPLITLVGIGLPVVAWEID